MHARMYGFQTYIIEMALGGYSIQEATMKCYNIYMYELLKSNICLITNETMDAAL